MTANFVNQTPYLRTSREFPPEVSQLTVEIDRAYIDIANAVNNRTISLYPTNRPAITGENWFVNQNIRQQTVRQVYRFTSFTNPLTIPHGIDTTTFGGFTNIYGTATDGTTWYPLPLVSTIAATNQISLIVNATNIVVTAGATVSFTTTSGFIVLEWLTQV